MYTAAELALDKKLICHVDVQCSNDRPENSLWNDNNSMLVGVFVLVVVALLIFGTCYDINVARPLKEKVREQQKADENEPLKVEEIPGDEKAKRTVLTPTGYFVTLIMMFSIVRNSDYIMDTSVEAGQIKCLHGARFLSMCWVIFGHTYYYICTSLTTDNLVQTLQEFPKYFYNQMVVQAPLAVDSFFYLR